MKIREKLARTILRWAWPLTILALPAGAGAHVISEADHHAFEHKFTDMCVKKEKARGGGDEAALTKLCECVAREESKRLTVQEVRKFVNENKYPVSLMIKSDLADYNCEHNK
jgi:hypothetical protein